MPSHKLAPWLISRVALPMAQASEVEGRLTAILRREGTRKTLTRRTLRAATLAMAALIVPLAAVRPVARAAAGPVPAARGVVGPVRKVARGLFEVQGVRVRAQAYTDHEYHDTPYRCALGVASAPPRTDHWALTYTGEGGAMYPDMADIEQEGRGFIGEAVAKADLTGRRRAVLRPHLRQYDTYDERVTFHDLHITRLNAHEPLGGEGFGFLTVTRPLTATTPSGVTVTLPVQNVKTMMGGWFTYNGPGGVTFVRAVLTPGQSSLALPASPLCQQHHVPVSVTLTAAAPVFTNSRLYNAAQPYMTISPPGRNVTHLDSLTLIVHQRADLQDIPLALPVPIDRHWDPTL